MSKRYEELDSLRGLASLTVVFSHCLITLPLFYAAIHHEKVANNMARILSHSPLHIFWAGHEAVILFFILSGFVLALGFLNKTVEYPQYIVKRFCRIYLPYIVTIVISGYLFILFTNTHHIDEISGTSNWFKQMWFEKISFDMVISFVFMLGSNTHNLDTVTWSLVHEMRISIFFPLMMLLIKKVNGKPAALVGMGVIVGSSYLYLFVLPEIKTQDTALLAKNFTDTLYYTAFFIFGAILAKYKDVVASLYKNLNIAIKIILPLAILIFYTSEWSFSLLGQFKYHGTPFIKLVFKTVIDLLTAAAVIILFIAVMNSVYMQKLLKISMLKFLGSISYSLYLIHPIVLLAIVHLFGNEMRLKFLIPVVVITSILVATFMYKLIEIPSMKLGRQISKFFKMKKANQDFQPVQNPQKF